MAKRVFGGSSRAPPIWSAWRSAIIIKSMATVSDS
ncbi:unnamed protein product [Medioppia subpectinata]|uniref:Uncharacterized protein n=1 Tax=Medioppia subpectinata TaxID=1979941 RepID=A0A7R9QN28_9ACAR|nr:unnamed protein product [Medioppia subpectinata]CAG2123461.1 unnamed protein product [Medioppia subpectinata]